VPSSDVVPFLYQDSQVGASFISRLKQSFVLFLCRTFLKSAKITRDRPFCITSVYTRN
jgi:hypothetical protein